MPRGCPLWSFRDLPSPTTLPQNPTPNESRGFPWRVRESRYRIGGTTLIVAFAEVHLGVAGFFVAFARTLLPASLSSPNTTTLDGVPT
jgi:hypothetical protein